MPLVPGGGLNSASAGSPPLLDVFLHCRVATVLGATTKTSVLPVAGSRRGQHPAPQALRAGASRSAVDPAQPRAQVVSAQHGDFVTQDQDLDVLGCVGSGEQPQPAQHAGEQQVRESEGHSRRSCLRAVDGGGEAGPLALNALVRRRATVLGTHNQKGTTRPGTGLSAGLTSTTCTDNRFVVQNARCDDREVRRGRTAEC